MDLLPYHGTVIHARWSGEALWSPLAAAWPVGQHLPREYATFEPKTGDILLYAGDLSEPELLIPYGTSRFASKAGLLEGNPVLTLDDSFSGLAELGRRALWNGAMQFRIEKHLSQVVRRMGHSPASLPGSVGRSRACEVPRHVA